jgi:hypothetical protein
MNQKRIEAMTDPEYLEDLAQTFDVSMKARKKAGDIHGYQIARQCADRLRTIVKSLRYASQLPHAPSIYISTLREHCRALTEVPAGAYDAGIVHEMASDATRLGELADWLEGKTDAPVVTSKSPGGK